MQIWDNRRPLPSGECADFSLDFEPEMADVRLASHSRAIVASVLLASYLAGVAAVAIVRLIVKLSLIIASLVPKLPKGRDRHLRRRPFQKASGTGAPLAHRLSGDFLVRLQISVVA